MKKNILFSLFLMAFTITAMAQSKTPTDTSQYATLYVYRPFNVVGMAISYNLNVDSNNVYRIKNNTKYAIKLYKEGPYELWARTESKESLNINVKHGEVYYIRCGLNPGVAVGRPLLVIEPTNEGKEAYSKIKK